MSTICVTCLSSERHLIQLKNLVLYTNWHGISLQMTDYICWECKAMFNNIWRFKQQVLTAQDLLRNQKLTEIPKVNQCLSKLTKSIKTSYDSEYYEDNVIKIEPLEPPSIDYLDETIIKKEVHFTVDCSYAEPMKTEIKETKLNNTNEEIEIEVCSDFQNDVTNETEQVNDSGTQIQSKNIPKVLPPHKYQPLNKEKLFLIKVMSEDEFLKARESDRELPKYKDSPYKCEKCIVGFDNEEQYNNHFTTRHAIVLGNFFCKICEVRFTNNSSYKTHTTKHYLCYQCKNCEVRSHRVTDMMLHRRKKHGLGKTYRCKSCNAEFDTTKRLYYHQMKEHSKPTCTVCGKTFCTVAVLKSHMLMHKDVPLVKCDICEKEYKNIKAHMYTHRHEVDAAENAFCAECNFQFKCVRSYENHLKHTTKHGDRNKFPCQCVECGKRFSNKHTLTLHLNAIHYDKKEFVCQICNKGYVKSSHLKNHMLYTHEGVSKPRKYICGICDRGFTSRLVLNNHIRTHTGERPFGCDLCDAKFAQKTALKTHVKGVHKKLYKKSAD